jgi:maleylpyruvate isomerase
MWDEWRGHPNRTGGERGQIRRAAEYGLRVTTTETDPAAFDVALDDMARATDRLLATVDAFADADVRTSSGLPDWTRAHVLTHVARNADAIANLAHWARTGEERPMYAGGAAGRDAAIQEGAGRHIGDLRLDIDESAQRLMAAFAGFDAQGLAREVEGMRGARFVGSELPFIRLLEVEIHHVDLAAGYTSADWSPEFGARTLDRVAPQFVARGDCPVSSLHDGKAGVWQVGAAGPTLSGSTQQLAGWLVGRSDGAALTPSPPGAIPAAPRWL